MGWQAVYLVVTLLIAAYAIRQRPQSQKPPGFEDLTVPTAKEGREIIIVFGTRDIHSPNIIGGPWNFQAKAIKKSSGK